MDWEALIDQECPKCSQTLKNTGSNRKPFYQCSDYDCTFKIGGERFTELVKEMSPTHVRERHYLSDNMMQPEYTSTVHSDSDDDDFFE